MWWVVGLVVGWAAAVGAGLTIAARSRHEHEEQGAPEGWEYDQLLGDWRRVG